MSFTLAATFPLVKRVTLFEIIETWRKCWNSLFPAIQNFFYVNTKVLEDTFKEISPNEIIS